MALPLPPLNLNLNDASKTTSGVTAAPVLNGASWGIGAGDWVVNVPTSAGSGLSIMGGASGSGLGKWGLIAFCGLAAFLFMRKKG